MAHDPGEWLGRHEAARLLGVSTHCLSRLQKANVFTVKKLPGTRPKILRSSIEALVASSIQVGDPTATPAKAHPKEKGATRLTANFS
jgi:hypothetical protein